MLCDDGKELWEGEINESGEGGRAVAEMIYPSWREGIAFKIMEKCSPTHVSPSLFLSLSPRPLCFGPSSNELFESFAHVLDLFLDTRVFCCSC